MTAFGRKQPSDAGLCAAAEFVFLRERLEGPKEEEMVMIEVESGVKNLAQTV